MLQFQCNIEALKYTSKLQMTWCVYGGLLKIYMLYNNSSSNNKNNNNRQMWCYSNNHCAKGQEEVELLGFPQICLGYVIKGGRWENYFLNLEKYLFLNYVFRDRWQVFRGPFVNFLAFLLKALTKYPTTVPFTKLYFQLLGNYFFFVFAIFPRLMN